MTRFPLRAAALLFAALIFLLSSAACAAPEHKTTVSSFAPADFFRQNAPSFVQGFSTMEPAASFALPDEFIPGAPHAGFYDASGKPLFSRSADVPIAPASLTKLVTACTALSWLDANTILPIGDELLLVHPGSSTSQLSQGQRASLYDLITAMLLPSGNDAAYTVAVNTARIVSGNPDMSSSAAVDYFCKLMNDFTAQIGARQSCFTTPEGWDDPAQYTTVNDLALIAAHAMNIPEIREIAAMSSARTQFASGEIFEWKNTNALLDPENRYHRSCRKMSDRCR